VAAGYLTPFALGASCAAVPALKATMVLRREYRDKERLLRSSRLAILAMNLVGGVLLFERAAVAALEVLNA
jgi:hypothetical protein